MDISCGDSSNGANIQMYEDNGTKAQKFKFVKAEKNESTKIEDGIYNIIAKSNENKVLQIENNSISNNAKAKFENRLNIKFFPLTKYYIICRISLGETNEK